MLVTDVVIHHTVTDNIVTAFVGHDSGIPSDLMMANIIHRCLTEVIVGLTKLVTPMIISLYLVRVPRSWVPRNHTATVWQLPIR